MRPVHCVTDTPGFNFHSELTRGFAGELVVSCGGDASLDSRSAFYDGRHKRKTTLDKALKTAGCRSCEVLCVPPNVVLLHICFSCAISNNKNSLFH